MATKIARGYVRTTLGEWYVQKEDDNRFGFSLFDDDQTFPGGFGIEDEWVFFSPAKVPAAIKEQLGWLLDD